MRNHSKQNRGVMGIVILAIAGIFLALHLALPGVTLWPSFLIALAVGTCIASHVGRNRRIQQIPEPLSDIRN